MECIVNRTRSLFWIALFSLVTVHALAQNNPSPLVNQPLSPTSVSPGHHWPLRHRGLGLSTKAKKFSAETRMLLGQMQVAHFIATRLRTNDLRRVSLL